MKRFGRGKPAPGALLHQSPAKLAIQGGKNFWALVPFTMGWVVQIYNASEALPNRRQQCPAAQTPTGRGTIFRSSWLI
jgi:hypothetical protein